MPFHPIAARTLPPSSAAHFLRPQPHATSLVHANPSPPLLFVVLSAPPHPNTNQRLAGTPPFLPSTAHTAFSSFERPSEHRRFPNSRRRPPALRCGEAVARALLGAGTPPLSRSKPWERRLLSFSHASSLWEALPHHTTKNRKNAPFFTLVPTFPVQQMIQRHTSPPTPLNHTDATPCSPHTHSTYPLPSSHICPGPPTHPSLRLS